MMDNKLAQALMMMPLTYESPYTEKISKMLNPLHGLHGVNIEKEYELIKQKKSKLSRRKRDQIVAYVERIRKEQG